MKKIRAISLAAAGLASFMLLAGCWDSSSSSSAPPPSDRPKTSHFSGIVEDPPVKGATVELWEMGGKERLEICGASGDVFCTTVSGEDGFFSLLIRNDRMSEGPFKIVARGGEDTVTGKRIGSNAFESPLDLFSDKGLLAVTPLTTLVTKGMEDGKNADEAKNSVRRFLGLQDDTDVMALPSTSGIVQVRASLISDIITKSDKPAPFSDFDIDSTPLTGEDGKVDPVVLEALIADPKKRDEITSSNKAMVEADANDPAAVVLALKRQTLQGSLMASMESLFGNADENFDGHRQSYGHSAAILATSLLEHTAMPAHGLAVERVFRYVIDAYDLVSMELSQDQTTYDVHGPLVDGTLHADHLIKDGVSLGKDPRIPQLAASPYLYDIALPLLPHELLGNDNAKRINYYYNSNASRLYKAETMLGTVLDDNVNDRIRVQIVSGMAKVGYFDRAKEYIDFQMYLPAFKVDAWMGVARGYLPFDRNSDAIANLDKAFALQKKIISSTGAINTSNADTARLQQMAALYRRAGNNDKAEEVMDYIGIELLPVLTGTSHHGRLIVAFRNYADELLAYRQEDTSSKDFAAARIVLENMHLFSSVQPPNDTNGEKSYRARVYSLAETALRFAALGDRERVEAIIDEIEALRENDDLVSFPDTNPQRLNLTKERSWSFVDSMVEALAEAGSEEKAWALIDTIPDNEVRAKSSSYEAIINFLARDNRPDELLEVLETHVVGYRGNNVDTDQTAINRIGALTYVNLVVPRAGVIFAEAGNHAAAERMGDTALGEVRRMYPNGSTPLNMSRFKVERGYVKIARVYHLAGAHTRAVESLEEAEEVLARIADPAWRINALSATGRMWEMIGERERSRALFEEGREYLALVAKDHAPAVLALQYNDLARAAIGSGSADLAPGLILAGEDFADKIFSDATPEAQRENTLVTAAQRYRVLGSRAWEVRDMVTAQRIFSKGQNSAEKLASLSNKTREMGNLARAAGEAGLIEFAMEAALAVPLIHGPSAAIPGRYDTIGDVAALVVKQDDFPDTDIAWVDTDKDGRPDFFHPLATDEMIAESGLELDPDSNGNGIPDTEDMRPIFLP
ncbi:hypothetical protein LZ24_01318 [Desulfobotulus alkaliphilus]|uniref:Tetratricopeptide repeat protein n=1 Tax=Desulfobotulus alkaliphilus TaxID=622671 RepID=A0A562RXU4_9BACT|nr:hypothetical protein [Desulfobotulus alkaliphilus]TWI73230.1 hypothetical protein LZ24_01318 [Desulfobotulus alkaliphilus]